MAGKWEGLEGMRDRVNNLGRSRRKGRNGTVVLLVRGDIKGSSWKVLQIGEMIEKGVGLEGEIG